MAALISDILGDGINSELDGLIKKLGAVEKELDVINSKTITLTVDYKGVGNISELTEAIKKQDEIIANLNNTKVRHKAVSDAMSESMVKGIAMIEQFNGSTEKMVRVSQGLADATHKEAQARNENAKAIQEETKLAIMLTKEKERIEKAAVKEAEALRKNQSAYAQLNAEYKAAAAIAKDLAAQQEFLTRTINDTSNAGKKVALTDQLKQLAIQTTAAQQKASGLHQALLKIDQAVGQSQRNVGNYNSAVFAMSQVIRELPSFAFSAATGILAISNNIPILIDEVQRLKVANEAVAAAGGKTIPIWKTLSQALFSFNGIVTLVMAAVTIFAGRLSMMGDEAEKSKTKLDSFKESVKAMKEIFDNLNASIATATDVEINKAERLVNAYNDVRTSATGRINTYMELQSMYPKILTALTDEEKKTGILSAAHDKEIEKLTQVIGLKNKMNEVDKLINADIKVKVEAEAQMYDLRKGMSAGTVRAIGRAITAQGDRLTHPTVNDPASGVDSDQANKYLDLRDKVLKTEKAIAAWKADQLKIAIQEVNLENAPHVKELKAKKDNSKLLNDELAKEQARYENDKLKNQAEYDAKDNSIEEVAAYHKKQLLKQQEEAEQEHAANNFDIIIKWHGKVGESEDKFNARMIQANNDKLAVENATNEAEKKLAQETMERHKREQEAIDKEIEKYKKAADEMLKIEAKIEAIKAKGKISHDEAMGLNPFLEGMGIKGLDHSDLKKKDIDIKASSDRMDNLQNKIIGENGNELPDKDKILGWQTDFANEKANLTQLEADRQAAIDAKILEGKREMGQKTVELAKQTFETIKQIQENAFAHEAQQIQIKQQQVELQAQQEMRAIDATTGFQIEKDNAKAKVAAETQAKENELQQQSNNLQLRQAKFAKEAAQLAIIANTAQALIKTLAAYAGIPGGVAIALPIMALEAAIGAAQYAAVASQPLPQFEKGGTTKTDKFIAGEKGAELGITPSGKAMLFDKMGVYSAPIGTKISSHEETKRLINYAVYGIGANNAGMPNSNVQAMTDKRIVEKLEDLTDATISAARNGRPIKNIVIIKNDNSLQRPN